MVATFMTALIDIFPEISGSSYFLERLLTFFDNVLSWGGQVQPTISLEQYRIGYRFLFLYKIFDIEYLLLSGMILFDTISLIFVKEIFLHYTHQSSPNIKGYHQEIAAKICVLHNLKTFHSCHACFVEWLFSGSADKTCLILLLLYSVSLLDKSSMLH